ncbi:MAG TPA: aspartate carbamoyltransferase catalytic subunit [Nitrospirales bacterium]|nr:aspartate carbamoyltransferase catalytic subunit [Nitrospirales bacterium]HIN33719.1 aspartate carbamoyltransferase catalytic subunit [Nitrospirales bacterium]
MPSSSRPKPAARSKQLPIESSPEGWTAGKDLLSIKALDVRDIELIIDTATAFQEVSGRAIKKVPALRGKTIANLFIEPSTRTRTSFELAAKRLSADVVNLSGTSSSIMKGESLIDTGRALESMGVDLVVIRHSAAGAAHTLARTLKAGVVNAGDGAHEHPTQALLDLFTIRAHGKNVAGLRVVMIGDITRSRVARSNIYLLTKLNANVCVVGPPTMIPPHIEKLGVSVSYDLESSLKGADMVMILRVQHEREQRSLFPSIQEYARLYGVTRERLALAAPNVLVLHPGPMNRGIEIATEVADGLSSVILDQVANGIAVRMGVLYLLVATREIKGGGVT